MLVSLRSFNHVFLQCDALLSKLCSVRLRPTFPDGPLRAEYAFTGSVRKVGVTFSAQHPLNPKITLKIFHIAQR